MRRATFVLVLALLSAPSEAAFAKGRAPKRRSGRGSAARGFGAAQSPSKGGKKPPPKAARAPTVQRPSTASSSGSLEKMLAEQHASNCADSASLWGTCGDGASSAYQGGWDAFPAPMVAPDNAPYHTERLILKSREPVLAKADCEALIAQMEAHGAANGWDSRYPVDGFTREVNVADIPASIEVLQRALMSTLLPAVAAEFGAFRASSLRVNEALVVKYDAATGNNCLPVHQDFSLFTINVALTDDAAFTGGGTWFQHDDSTVVARRGEALMHAGGIPHCGVPVKSGCRYQLVLFLSLIHI